MTKVEWILTIIAIGLGIAMIVSSILHVLREREIKQTRRAYWTKYDDAIKAQQHEATLDTLLARRNEELQEAKATIKARDLEIERLQKSADHATVPLAEAVPARPSRGGRGKKAGQA